ncbi:MAG: T9SS type A sorting domain-containing protein [Bacteroidetes bacterium]|nr:T9SS type A sorting domain-containing protein [Bacteroidota bacterium]
MLLLSVSFLVVLTAIAPLEAASRKGWFKIGTMWIEGTISGSSISVSDGVITAEPPATLELDTDPKITIDGGTGAIVVPFSPNKPLGKISMLASMGTNINVSNEGIHINSSVPLDLTIYDLSGKNVYSATSQNNVLIGNNTLNSTNGLYMVRLVNMEGKENIITFIFHNNSFIFNDNEELCYTNEDLGIIIECILSTKMR